MRWLLYGLLAAALGAGAILLIAEDSGYILISIGRFTLEMSFWFGLLCLTLTIYLVWKLYKLFLRCRDALAGSVSWISESRSKRIERRTTRGLIYFVEGNWRSAKKELLAAAKLEKKPLLQYLAAANSAFELGDEEETRFLLQQAEKLAPENELAILLTQARLDIDSHNYERALTTLKRADLTYSNDPVVLKLLKAVYVKLKAWQALLDLIPRLKSSKSFKSEELKDLEVLAWKGQLDIALAKAAELNSSPRASFENIWKGVPADVKKDTSLIVLYVERLLKAHFDEEAANVLVPALKNNWSSPLLALYAQVKTKDKKQHLLQAETWLREHPGDADLMFVLGKLARANELWGKAKDYLEKSILLKPEAATYAELAELLAHLGKHKESVDCYHKGLSLIHTPNALSTI